MSTNPKFNEYLRRIEGAQPSSAFERYKARIEAAQPEPSPVERLRAAAPRIARIGAQADATAVGGRQSKRSYQPEPKNEVIIDDFVRSGLSMIPFTDEIGAGIASLGASRGEETIPEAYSRIQQELKDESKAFEAEHPRADFAGKALGFAASVPLTGNLGPVKGAAVLGAAQAAGEAEGLGNRAIAAPIGAGLGAALGYGGQLLARVGGTRAGALVGGAAGASQGDGTLDTAAKTAAGVAAGAGVGRIGSRAATAITNRFSRLGIADDLAASQVARAIEREGLDEAAIQAAGNTPGTLLVDIGSPGGPLQRLARGAQAIPSAGSKQIGETLSSRSAIAPNRFEKAVRKALGNRFTPPNPIVQQTRRAISAEAKPAYDALAGKEVSGEKLFQLIQDEPIARDLWKRAQELASKRVRAGFDDAEVLPDLFNVADDGSVEFLQETVPVRGLDMLKRALRSQVERSRNSPNPIDAEEAAVLSRRLDDIIATAKQESPEYANALRTFGEASERQVQGLAKQRQASDFVLGNSQTSRIQQDVGDLGASFSLSDLAPRTLFDRALNSTVAARLQGLDEATVDRLAPMLLQRLEAGGADDVIALLREWSARAAERQSRAAGLSRAAASGTGILTGSLLKERRP